MAAGDIKKTALAPLIVIAGPTASGKTALAVKLAKQFDGEIIAADSRTVYKGMDIGTAKPTIDEQDSVPHWGLDLVEPGQDFSASDFQAYARRKIDEIRARGHVPFLVGGTGLYIDSIIFDYQFGPKRDVAFWQELEAKSLDELYDYCYSHNINLPQNQKNKRYVIRAIEQGGINKQRSELIENVIVVGITTKKTVLRYRIEKRAHQLFDLGMVEEAQNLGKKYGWNSEAMTGNIYHLARDYQAGKLTRTELESKFIVSDWRLAKRQLTWLRRNPEITWLMLEESEHYIASVLADWHPNVLL